MFVPMIIHTTTSTHTHTHTFSHLHRSSDHPRIVCVCVCACLRMHVKLSSVCVCVCVVCSEFVCMPWKRNHTHTRTSCRVVSAPLWMITFREAFRSHLTIHINDDDVTDASGMWTTRWAPPPTPPPSETEQDGRDAFSALQLQWMRPARMAIWWPYKLSSWSIVDVGKINNVRLLVV